MAHPSRHGRRPAGPLTVMDQPPNATPLAAHGRAAVRGRGLQYAVQRGLAASAPKMGGANRRGSMATHKWHANFGAKFA